MKGLLLKDWYMMKKYYRAYLVIAAIFIAVSFISNDNMFFVFYPCVLCGVIPVNLLSYDERSRWIQYSGTLPYTKKQIVSAKYLIGLLTQITMAVVIGIAQVIKMSINGNLIFNDFILLMLLILTISAVTSSLTLPFIFKLGIEKGRIAYYIMVGLACGAGGLVLSLSGGQLGIEIQTNTLYILISIVGIAAYILSWYLSVVFYSKREI